MPGGARSGMCPTAAGTAGVAHMAEPLLGQDLANAIGGYPTSTILTALQVMNAAVGQFPLMAAEAALNLEGTYAMAGVDKVALGIKELQAKVMAPAPSCDNPTARALQEAPTVPTTTTSRLQGAAPARGAPPPPPPGPPPPPPAPGTWKPCS
uniref:Uncharacterized protein n=1 Tax=Chlamydomonas leiostraca TaxID=1034604 RepID=A0A7S0WLT8_9CHLO|mmetsp:Transcript_18273/g.46140  ORF Transcript_18273/g.46140 Transcript_18273/m.46140 type:complete len:152 (+) Transcript_18273:446-901(+)